MCDFFHFPQEKQNSVHPEHSRLLSKGQSRSEPRRLAPGTLSPVTRAPRVPPQSQVLVAEVCFVSFMTLPFEVEFEPLGLDQQETYISHENVLIQKWNKFTKFYSPNKKNKMIRQHRVLGSSFCTKIILILFGMIHYLIQLEVPSTEPCIGGYGSKLRAIQSPTWRTS